MPHVVSAVPIGLVSKSVSGYMPGRQLVRVRRISSQPNHRGQIRMTSTPGMSS
jgi:hypothetical protein